MSLVVFVSLLAMLPVQPDTTISSDSFEFREIAQVPYSAFGRITCGDADHDGLQEFYGLGQHFTCILEFTPDMNYDTTRLEVWPAYFWFLSDLDRDGKTDLGLDITADTNFYVYESADSASLPLQCVWTGGIGATPYAIVTDLDRDSAREITLKDLHHHSGLSVFEYVADDSYAFRGALPDTPRVGIYGFGSAPDVDRDGWPELFKLGAFVAASYEAVGNDSFVITAICSLPLPNNTRVNSGAVVAGPDIDGDGRAEAILFGADYYNLGTLAIIESPGNDSIEVVWHTYFPSSRLITPTLSVGDVDGDGVPEIAVGDGAYARLFRCIGNDQYEQFWQQYTGLPEVGLYDLNNDGKAEVICVTPNQTIIYEYFSLGLAERQMAELERVRVPAVVARGKVVRVNWEGGKGNGAKVEVLDATGRVVAVPKGTWNTTSVAPGAYFVRVGLGTQSVTRKVLVVQ